MGAVRDGWMRGWPLVQITYHRTCPRVRLTLVFSPRKLNKLNRAAEFPLIFRETVARKRSVVRRRTPIFLRKFSEHGHSSAIPVYPFAERCPHLCYWRNSVRNHAHAGPWSFLCSISFVLRDHLRRSGFRADVLGHRRLSPVFFASLVQDEPRVSVCDRLYGDDLRAKGRALVGGASPASSSLFGSGRGFALADVVWVFLVPHR